MPDRLFDYLVEVASRRTILKRAVQAAGAVGLSLLGVREAEALFSAACCSLYRDPSSCTYANCACEWCWTCCVSSSGCIYACDECFSPHKCVPDMCRN